MKIQNLPTAVLAALGAAALFGASTPFAKQFVGDMSALLLAGLLYLGSGVGLLGLRFMRDRGWRNPGLALFVLALRDLGAARTGAYFGAAPFMGAAIAIGVFHEATSSWFWVAGLLMAAGLWLHLTERHAHTHRHVPLRHGHPHTHDLHH